MRSEGEGIVWKRMIWGLGWRFGVGQLDAVGALLCVMHWSKAGAREQMTSMPCAKLDSSLYGTGPHL